MKTSFDDKLGILSYLAYLDDRLIRVLAFLEIICRSKTDFQGMFRNIFGRTWEHKFLRLLINNGPMNKAQLCSKLFPKLRDSHYKLSRTNEVSSAFNYLLKNRIIAVVEERGRMKLYDISPEYKPILRVMFCSDGDAQSEPC